MRRVTSYFFKNGIINRLDATLHDTALGVDVPIKCIDDPAELLIANRTCFHCCFDGIRIHETHLPTLGVFFSSDMIDIDYRMSDEWTLQNVEAFFRLLHKLKAIAPDGRFQLGDLPPPPFPESFNRALNFILTDQCGF